MKKKELKNVAASVRQRLANVSKAEGVQFLEVLRYYGMEYRIQVPVLKG